MCFNIPLYTIPISYLQVVSQVLLYRYICTKLPVHLFLTMKSIEHTQIWILKLPPMSRPNCGIIYGYVSKRYRQDGKHRSPGLDCSEIEKSDLSIFSQLTSLWVQIALFSCGISRKFGQIDIKSLSKFELPSKTLDPPMSHLIYEWQRRSKKKNSADANISQKYFK